MAVQRLPSRRTLALALAAVLVAGACSASPSALVPTASSGPPTAIEAHAVPTGATASVDDATWALAARITSPTYTGDNTDAFKAALARAGIAVLPDTSTDPATAAPEVPLSGPPSPVELLDFQAHALALGAWAGATWTGAELDSLVPLPPDSGSPSLAELLDGYVGAVDTPGGALGRALMAGQDLHDPATVRFPAAVLFLMVSDVATEGGGIGAPSASPSAAVRLLPLGTGPVVAAPAIDITDFCAGPDGLIDAVVQKIEDALVAAIPQTVAGVIVVTILGFIIHTVASVVKGVINALVGPALNLIRSIFVLASGIAEQIASVMPYVAHVTVNGGEGSGTQYSLFTLGSDPQVGSYDVAVTAGDLPPWPDVIVECARKADLTLPDFSTKNAPLTFGPVTRSYDPTPLLARGSAAVDDTVTDQTGQAHWPFVVGEDPGQGKGTVTYQSDTMPVAVHRKEIQEARDALTNALLHGLPPILKQYVNLLLQPILDTFQSKVNDLLDARGDATVYLKYRLPSPSPSLSSAPSGSGACAVAQPAATDQGSLTIKSTTIIPQGQIDLGEHGGENDAGSAPLSVAVGADGSLSGQFTLTSQNHFEAQGISQGTEDTTVVETGSIGGTLCAFVFRFLNETITACQATGYGTCGGVGQSFDLSGLVPPEPMGASAVSGKTMTWSFSNEATADAGFGGLSSEVQSTITVTLTAP